MASGLCTDANGVGLALLNWLTAQTATALTVTQPYKVAFMTAVRTNNDNVGGTTDSEWTTGGSYTATAGGSTGGVAYAATAVVSTAATATGGSTHTATDFNNAAAITQTNCPAGTWAGNLIKDTTAVTNKNIWFGTLTGGNKTINTGDTCTLPQTTGMIFTLG